MKKLSRVLLAVVLCTFAIAAFAKQKPTSLVISSGNSGGTYYYIAAGQSKILNEKLKGINVTTESTSGSPVENLTFCSEDPAVLGFTTLDGLFAAVNGDKSKGFRAGPVSNVALLQAGHTLILYGVTKANSGINSIADLKGKKISVPTIGNTAYFQTIAILKQYGIDPEKDLQAVPMLYAEAADALKDGSLDAIWIAGGIPQAAVTDLDTTQDIKFLTFEPEKAEEILKAYPYWGLYTIPAGTYKHMDKDTVIMTAIVTIAANTDLDDDLVYDIAKTLNESVDDLTVIHQDGKNWNAQNTLNVIERGIVPVHPGAMRYYEEVKAKANK